MAAEQVYYYSAKYYSAGDGHVPVRPVLVVQAVLHHLRDRDALLELAALLRVLVQGLPGVRDPCVCQSFACTRQ